MQPHQHSRQGALSYAGLASDDQSAVLLQNCFGLGNTVVLHELGHHGFDDIHLGLRPVVDATVQNALEHFSACQPKFEVLLMDIRMSTE